MNAKRLLPWGGFLESAAVVALCTAVDWVLFADLDLANLVMVYLLGVLWVAYRHGRAPSVAASVVSVLAFDFFFVPPRFTLAVANVQHVFIFIVMLLVALSISNLTVRVKREADLARLQERRTAALYALSGELVTAHGTDALLAIAVRHVAQEFESSAVALLPDPRGKLTVRSGAIGSLGTVAKEVAVAQWSYDVGQLAGNGTETVATAEGLYVPLVAAGRPLGTLGVRPTREDHRLTDDQVRLLEAFANQTALAVDSDRLAEANRRIELQVETERLRSSLLSSVSHDLRTPLAGITGSASALLRDWDRLEAPGRQDLLENIHEEAGRLSRLVNNLLQMTRLESGSIHLGKELHHLEEIVGSALTRLEPRLDGRPVTTDVAADLPMVPLDALLIEQVLVNLVENALKYTPAGSPIEIAAEVDRQQMTVTVCDRGPGIPMSDLDHLFDKFYRGRANGQQGGAGLGLAICKAVVAAHGGRIVAGNRTGGGAIFEFSLPLADTPGGAA
jgi:two-component system sensor histidine kinase KdpD